MGFLTWRKVVVILVIVCAFMYRHEIVAYVDGLFPKGSRSDPGDLVTEDDPVGRVGEADAASSLSRDVETRSTGQSGSAAGERARRTLEPRGE
jgi:hypothetical protein